jgi:GNAT superfamily N-acetyltransferase
MHLVGTDSVNHVRIAHSDDAAAIAALHVCSWQLAYRGQIPDDYLDGLTAELPERTAQRREYLTFPRPDHRTWVAERDGCVVGFAHIGPSREQDLPTDTAEVYAIYLDPDVVGTGVGRMLFARAIDDLRLRGLWDSDALGAHDERARTPLPRGGWLATGRRDQD